MRQWWRSYGLLLRWTLLRKRKDLPFFLAVQTLISVGVVMGFSFLIPELDRTSALYLTTGAMTIALITVGMVGAPSMVAYQRVQGVFDFQRCLPVPRLALLAADATVWISVALPGLLVTLLVAAMRFDLSFSPSPLVVPAVLLVSTGAVAIGYCIAYAVKPVLINLVTNAIIIVALMFAPINYPAERLPGWLAGAHQVLPFTYMAQAIRETIDVPPGGVPVFPFLVLAG